MGVQTLKSKEKLPNEPAGGSKEPYTEGMFIDSGAHSLYYAYVAKRTTKIIGKHGRELEAPPTRWMQGDFSYFDLKAGSDFRKYCDSYASFVRKTTRDGMLYVSVDVIGHPELSWQIWDFFTKEHALHLMPVLHVGTDFKYLDKYLDRGCGLIGVGGAWRQGRSGLLRYADTLFRRICPASKGYLPQVRVHGFAVTSWEMITRYPWWSVDSSTWVKLSAYGWIYIPRWSDKIGWCFDRPPMMINFSHRSPHQKKKDKHYGSITKQAKEAVHKWLKELGLEMGSVTDPGSKKAEMVKFGVTSHHRARNVANLTYFKELEKRCPKWPFPLSPQIAQADNNVKGFGF